MAYFRAEIMKTTLTVNQLKIQILKRINHLFDLHGTKAAPLQILRNLLLHSFPTALLKNVLNHFSTSLPLPLIILIKTSKLDL